MITRVDKILSELGLGSRQEIKKYIKSGRVKLNEGILKRSEEKIDTERDRVFFDGKIVEVSEFETYYFINRPVLSVQQRIIYTELLWSLSLQKEKI